MKLQNENFKHTCSKVLQIAPEAQKMLIKEFGWHFLFSFKTVPSKNEEPKPLIHY